MNDLTEYKKERGKIETGDLLFFSGKGHSSSIIKMMSCSPWSHVGMALRIEEWDMLMLWESTTLSNVPDFEAGVEMRGVQVVPLSERLKSYDGEVGVRPLAGVKRDKEFQETIKQVRRGFKGRPYERSRLELLRAAFGGFFGSNKEEDLSSIFCSELVVEAYQRLGLLSEEKPSNTWTPGELASPMVSLLNGAYFAQFRPLIKEVE